VARSRRSRRTLTVIILVVLSLSLISLDLNGRTHSVTSGIKSVANDIYAPLHQGILDIISPIGSFFAGAFDYGSVQAQNEQLEKTIGDLRASQDERSYQLNQLRELTKLQNLPFLGLLPLVTAQTIDEYSSNFTATITLDKGRADGVDVGYPVVGAGGLVGQVIQSFHNTCVVQLISDGQSKVGVTFGSANQYSGIVDGQGPGNSMTADLVQPHTPLHKGEVMFTSGLQAASYPAGIPVATVRSFHTASGASQETIEVNPAANLSQLAYVDVVQWAPNT
jgi:rod shape-determining protein MreC